MFDKFGYMKKISLGLKLMTFVQAETCFTNNYFWKFLAEKKSCI